MRNSNIFRRIAGILPVLFLLAGLFSGCTVPKKGVDSSGSKEQSLVLSETSSLESSRFDPASPEPPEPDIAAQSKVYSILAFREEPGKYILIYCIIDNTGKEIMRMETENSADGLQFVIDLFTGKQAYIYKRFGTVSELYSLEGELLFSRENATFLSSAGNLISVQGELSCEIVDVFSGKVLFTAPGLEIVSANENYRLNSSNFVLLKNYNGDQHLGVIKCDGSFLPGSEEWSDFVDTTPMGGKWYIIEKDGQSTIVTTDFQTAVPFQELEFAYLGGDYFSAYKDSHETIISAEDGRVVFEPGTDKLMSYFDGELVIYDDSYTQNSLCTTNGDTLAQHAMIYPIEGTELFYAADPVMYDDSVVRYKEYFLNRAGTVVWENESNGLWRSRPISEKLWPLMSTTGFIGVIDMQGNTVLEPEKYTAIDSLRENGPGALTEYRKEEIVCIWAYYLVEEKPWFDLLDMKCNVLCSVQGDIVDYDADRILVERGNGYFSFVNFAGESLAEITIN